MLIVNSVSFRCIPLSGLWSFGSLRVSRCRKKFDYAKEMHPLVHFTLRLSGFSLEWSRKATWSREFLPGSFGGTIVCDCGVYVRVGVCAVRSSSVQIGLILMFLCCMCVCFHLVCLCCEFLTFVCLFVDSFD